MVRHAFLLESVGGSRKDKALSGFTLLESVSSLQNSDAVHCVTGLSLIHI